MTNVRTWAKAYAATRKGMPPRSEVASMAARNGISEIVAAAIVMAALAESQDREAIMAMIDESEKECAI